MAPRPPAKPHERRNGRRRRAPASDAPRKDGSTGEGRGESRGESRRQWLAALGYAFNDESLLIEALTHSSYAHEQNASAPVSYQRLEFLGDAVLQLIVSQTLMQRFPQLPEGHLTRLRAELVKGETLAVLAEKWQLGPQLLLGRGEQGPQPAPAILADALEALLGAVYLDSHSRCGLEAAQNLVERLFAAPLATLHPQAMDPRMALNNRTFQEAHSPPAYRLLGISGPPHRRTYEMAVILSDGRIGGKGQGASKKLAARQAALAALQEEPPTLPHSAHGTLAN